MQIARLMGSTAAAPTGTGSATTVESAHYVMLHNSGTTLRLVTVQTAADGTTLATMQLSGGDRVIILDCRPSRTHGRARTSLYINRLGYELGLQFAV